MDINPRVVLAEYERLPKADRRRLEEGLIRIHGRKFNMTLEELASYTAAELGNIYRIIQGIHLTRQYVPDLREAYHSMEVSDLPSRVSFGRNEHESE